MKIAVTYKDGNVFQHYGHTEEFKIYDVDGTEIKDNQVVPTNGAGHAALTGFLKEHEVTILICGGIGGGAKTALTQAGITIFGGVSGKADDKVKEYLEGKLVYNPDVMCSHHGKDHVCHS